MKGTIAITGAGVDAAASQRDEIYSYIIFKNCAPFTYCITEINNTQIDNVSGIDVLIPMYNSIEYSDNYLNASGSL